MLQVTFLMMPVEIGWAATVMWTAGDVLCRVCAFFKIFGLFLSGNILICISLDRYTNVYTESPQKMFLRYCNKCDLLLITCFTWPGLGPG